MIGQADFASKQPNRDGPVTDQGLNFPIGLWADPTRLFITDTNNHRILIVPTAGSL